MNKEYLIEIAVKNGYTYEETPTEINIRRITGKLEDADECITLDKDEKTVMLWTTKNGTGKSHTLNKFELEVLVIFSNWMEVSEYE